MKFSESRILGMIRDAANTPVKTRVKTPEQILLILADKLTLTLAEVAAAVGKSVSAVERAAAKLAKEYRLKYTGPHKGGRWEVLG